MKHLLLITAISLLTLKAQAQNVGIGTTTPTASAQLDVTSTSKGLLPPRMTITQRNAIVSPVAGLMIWCTNCVTPAGELEIYNGYSWTNMTGGTSPSGTVTICSQDWMTKNLDVATYRNGDSIPNVTDPTAWVALTTGAYCYYDNDSATYAATYGKLYNWYAVNDPRGLAPAGWHVPSNSEWNILVKCIDPAADTTCSNCSYQSLTAGGAMKETGTTHWLSPNTGASNTSGFTGLPGGTHYDDGFFYDIGWQGVWWSSTESMTCCALTRILDKNNARLSRFNAGKRCGHSVRCLRD